VNWADLFLGIYYSLLPKSYWGRWRPSSTVDLQRSAMMSGACEFLIGAMLLFRRFVPFVIARAHQLKPLAHGNQGTQLYLSGVLMAEYLVQPLSVLLVCLVGEGFVRWCAVWSVEDVLPSLPLKIASIVQARHERTRQEKRLGPIIPDVMDALKDREFAIRILSCRAKEGWRESVTIIVDEDLYELAKLGTGTPTHPFEYLLRKYPPGKVIRGAYRYEGDSSVHKV
jgi:hypothetical protein